ncbi:cold-regulated protein 27 isoform X2 [Alnus glutinosa]|uniref:cold-regulated protein 27 isoform X2 n=1 Tax=Alnus glutinosa TaxID=3517 RepID=UPI002D798B69|nr:cold-regulated protein 27 isoform X2 [Alnus glutinosa]
MRENLRPNIPPPQATAGCGSELTRTNSDSSAITADTSKEPSRHCGNAKAGQLTEWTDQKHSLYLDSLEASFVTELQRSMRLRGLCSQDNVRGTYSPEEPRTKTRKSSDEFMVLRDGCWQKINFERKDNLLDSTADSHVVLGSPWIRHFTSSGKQRTERSLYVQEDGVLFHEGTHLKGNLTSASGSSRGLDHQGFFGSSTEISDQNFVDEDQGEKSSCASKAKRLKASAADATSSDQVVPLGKFHTTDVSTPDNASSEREQEGHYELLSENPESHVCPKSDLHYFLKGS